MKTFLKSLLLGYLVLASANTVFAQAKKAPRARVSVVCTCDDTTGKLYVEALHNALNRSQHYREVGRSEGLEENAIRINIVSLPLETEDGRPPRSALSIVCLHNGAIIHQFVQTCAHIPIEECAESMLSDLLEWEAGSRT